MSGPSSLLRRRQLPADEVFTGGDRAAVSLTGRMELLDRLLLPCAAHPPPMLVICHHDDRPQAAQRFPRSECVSTTRAGLYGMKIRPALLRRLRTFRPNLFVILYRNSDGTRHKRAELLALLSPARRLVGCTSDGICYRLSHTFLLWRIIEPLFRTLIVKPACALARTTAFLAYLAFRAVRENLKNSKL